MHLNELITGLSGNKDIYVASVDGKKCDNLDDLFHEFKIAFKFPDYFGYNWAAFDECLNDLDWLDSKAYVLFISDVDIVLKDNEQDFILFLKYLRKAVSEWLEGRQYDDFPTPKTEFHLYLHSSDKNKVALQERIGMSLTFKVES
jgi:RNAse (barnase) inhibitor barstar